MSMEQGTPVRTADIVTFPQAPAPRQAGPDALSSPYDAGGIGIAKVDAEGRLLQVNEHLCRLMDRSAAELLGRSIFDETHMADVGPDLAQFRRQVAGEIEGYSIEKRLQRKDGGHFWAAITSSSVRDAAGAFLHAVRMQYDITDRKRAQEALTRRAEEQAALYELTENLQHAASLADVYEPTLTAILRALRCQRASILLFDKTDVMRFVASRGLSDEYRRSVEGHSPWTRDSPNPQPIVIGDVAAAALPDELKRAVGAEGIGALLFIPLIDGGRVLGKFMAYYDAPHEFSDAEIASAVTIARQLEFGVGRIRAQQIAQQFVSIVESTDDAVISKDLDGIIITWNRGAERIFGYTADEVIGKPVTILIPKDRLDEEPGILARIRRGERIDHYETVRRRKDGSLLDISLTVSPMRDSWGRVIGASKIARDITDRKQAEAKLRDSERHLQELLAAVPAAIYTTDAEGKITYFNQAAVDLAGRTPKLGSDEWCVTWKLFRPDGTPLPHDQCPMAIALKEGRPIRNAEAVAERPDGSRVPFIPYPTPLRDAAGNVVGAINMLVDISERRQAETQQRVLLSELNHRVKNNMQMLQSLLQASAGQSRSPEARKILADASSRISAMAAAQRVLYATSDATRFSAQEFLGSVCETAQQSFPDGVTIVQEAASGELSNDIALPLALILNELLTNAFKYAIKDRGKGTIRVGLQKQGEEFILYVEDDGPGFDLESVREGSSGLRLVQGLARQIRGRFEVTRQPASRCTLYFS